MVRPDQRNVLRDKLKILVVEDDATYAEFVVDTLRAAGHDIVIATTGAAALELATSHAPDAVVLDLNLPDATGYDIARTLRRATLADTSIIILLTADRYPHLDRAEAVGVDLVLNKPVESQLVTGMIDLIRARRQRRPPSEK